MTKTKKTAKAEPAKKNAAQTIEALENAFMGQNQQIQILASEIDKLRQILTALNKRINASIQAAEEGSLNVDSVNKIVIQENTKELEEKIKFLVNQGVLKGNNEMGITDKTFVVGREVDATGNVVNPRVQFAVGSIDKTVQEKLFSKKVGDRVVYSDTEPSFEITEVYEIHQPTTKNNYEATPTDT